jgi:hypothetical protein
MYWPRPAPKATMWTNEGIELRDAVVVRGREATVSSTTVRFITVGFI